MTPFYVESILLIVINIFNNKITTVHSILRKYSHPYLVLCPLHIFVPSQDITEIKWGGGKKAANFSRVISPHHPSWLSLIASIVYFMNSSEIQAWEKAAIYL